jgi:hypothetical protein
MSLRFALRPRIRLHESAEPSRARGRKLPSMVLPVAGYWLGMAALTHVVILVGRGEAAEWTEPSVAEVAPASPPERALERAPLAAQPERAPAPVAAPPSVVSESSPSEPEEEEARPAPEAPAPLESRVVQAIPREPLAARSEDPVEHDRHEPPLVLPKVEVPPPPESDSAPISSGLPSCESVVEKSSQSIDFESARARTPDLPDEAFSSVLNHGGYLSACSIPDGTALDICVAVQAGQVRGVSVQARPPNRSVSACVARAAARLRFPHSPRLDVARTHFDALR